MNTAYRSFNTTRVELWQMTLDVGDYFAAVVQPNVIVYGVILPATLATPMQRRARVYASAIPDGEDDTMEVHMMDFPLTKKQFELARRLGWPDDMPTFRSMMWMLEPGEA